MATPATPSIDFSRVQYDQQPAPEQCHYCGRGIEAEHYRIADQTACTVCAANVRNRFPADSHRAYMGALLWGIPAAILGMAIYAGFEIVTHISIGYLAIAVGYLVAKAMRRGSGGVGGRRYQWTAVLLTYAAVAMAFIPMVISQSVQDKKAETSATATASPGRQGSATESAVQKDHGEEEHHSLLYSLGFLLGLGLISPFYELATSFASGLIGLLILFWGMRAAWQMSAGPAVAMEGPFPVGGP